MEKVKGGKSRKREGALPTSKWRGTPCPRCGFEGAHAVTHTYPNLNRRCVCVSCGKPFIAVAGYNGFKLRD